MKPPRISLHYGIEGFKGNPQSGSHCTEKRESLSQPRLFFPVQRATAKFDKQWKIRSEKSAKLVSQSLSFIYLYK